MGTHRLIFIRTDGNSNLATGHVMRCLSIAEACQALGMEVRFLVSDQESASLILRFNNDACVTILKTACYNSLERELPEVLLLLQSVSDPVLLVDSYAVTSNYLTGLRPYARLAYLDDLQSFDYPVDLIINYDVIPDFRLSAYEQAYSNAGIRLLGASYTPLRSQFFNRSATLRKNAENILITTGGTDQEHFCLGLLKQLRTLSDHFLSSLTFHLVIGDFNTDREFLRQTVSPEKISETHASVSDFPCRILLHEHVTDMASLMLSCDLAVSAAGTTLYELCALGIPAVSIVTADNQLTSAAAFADTGVIPCAGNLILERSSVYAKVFHFVEEMTSASDNYAKRESAQIQMRRLIDGSGSARIAKALQKL